MDLMEHPSLTDYSLRFDVLNVILTYIELPGGKKVFPTRNKATLKKFLEIMFNLMKPTEDEVSEDWKSPQEGVDTSKMVYIYNYYYFINNYD